MPLLFCNTAWMNKYGGRSAEDPPKGGGGYVVEHGRGGEECNFVACEDGYVYGHFETYKGDLDRQVMLERLGASKRDDYLDGVDIVWTAPTQGSDPRAVIGWSRNSRLYRRRQRFNDYYPSDQHRKDKIESFMVRSKVKDVVLLRPEKRNMKLQRGAGWSGEVSWWYADDTKNPAAKRFVSLVRATMRGLDHKDASIVLTKTLGSKGRAGAASAVGYRRYVGEHEVQISPRHNNLQQAFKMFLCKNFPKVIFPACFRDDLRYAVTQEYEVMVEVKPCDFSTVRFAIRAAIGQLLDYKQHQGWTGKQLILVETVVGNVEDRLLALDNGFGLAWPEEKGRFRIIWP